MAIWSGEIKELEQLYQSLSGQLPELEKELGKVIKADDENVVLLYSRRCLEVIVSDQCERELNRPRKTEPLKGIIDKLNKEEKVPSHIITSMLNLNSLSAYGTHPKEFDPEQVKPVLNNLTTIIKWYLKYKNTQTSSKPEEKVKDVIKSADDSEEETQKPKKRLILLLSGPALVVVIVVVGLFIFDIIGGDKRIKELEKSIAVLPFINDSPDEENTYFINGLMEEILLNLQTIKDFQVPGRTSVEQYRDRTKSIPMIANELDVNYIIEGSGQKYGNTVRLRIQLLEGNKGRHLWGASYEQEIVKPEDIFRIQSQIAEAIADELRVIISPEEKQLIEKTPTTSLTAHDFFQKGREEQWKYSLKGDRKALEKAENLYHKALYNDSTFAQAYTGLAAIYWSKHYWETYFAEEFLDSILILADIALSYDDQLSEAYTIRGGYYYSTGNPEQALEEFDKAITYNPNDWRAYRYLGFLYSDYDHINCIANYQRAVSLHRGEQLPGLLRNLGGAYQNAGFFEKAKKYHLEALKLDGDSLSFYRGLAVIEEVQGNFINALEFAHKAYEIDTSSTDILYKLGLYRMFLEQYKESLEYFEKCIEITKVTGDLYLYGMHRFGYAYWQNGFRKEAAYYFDKQIEYDNSEIRLGRQRSAIFYAYYDLAGVYAFLGERQSI